MPILLKPETAYETRGGHKAFVSMALDKADKSGNKYLGIVNDHDGEYSAFWCPKGICATKPEYSIVKLWPAEDTRRFQPIMQREDGVMTILGYSFTEIAAAKGAWGDNGVRYLVKIETSPNGGPPLLEAVDLNAA